MLGLLLHAIEEPSKTRGTTLRHARALSRYSRDIQLFSHNVMDPVTDYLKRIKYDIILLDATFLCLRWSRPRTAFEEIKQSYAWLRDADACKLAFPQDDYDHGGVLDDWLADYGVHVVYSILPEHRDLVYARCSRSARVKFALCGYIDDDDVAQYQAAQTPFAQRTIDIGYRVRDLPAQFGRFGRIKARLGTEVMQAAQGRGFALDIVVGEGGTIVGNAWPRFLGDCRYSLGSEGGSSVFDPYGEVKDRIDRLRSERPEASVNDLIEMGVAPADEKFEFSMPTPRIFEIAMAGSCPVLVRGKYLGLLSPGDHYIPIERDFSNIGEALDAVSDIEAGERMARATASALLEAPDLRYRAWVEEIRGDIDDISRGVTRNRMSLEAAHDLFGLHQDACREVRVQTSRRMVVAMQAEIDRLAAATTEAAGLIRRQQDEYSRIAGERDDVARRMVRLQAEVEQAVVQRDEAFRDAQRVLQERDDARRDTERVSRERDDAFLDVQRLSRERDDAHVEIGRIRSEVAQVSVERDEARREVDRLSGSLKNALDDLEYALRVVSTLREQIETPPVREDLVGSRIRTVLRRMRDIVWP